MTASLSIVGEAHALTPHLEVQSEGRVDGISLGDVDGDGLMESAVLSREGSFSGGVSANGSLALFSSGGDLLWEKNFDTRLVGTATFGDLDGDGNQEIVVCELSNVGVCRAFDGDGRELWVSDVFYTPGMTASGPAAEDLLGDGADEVVVASWGGEVAVLEGRTGTTIWRNEEAGAAGENFFGSPVVGDLDGDGHAEIVVADYTKGSIRTFDGQTGALLWSDLDLRSRFGNYAQATHVLITDLDNDRTTLEVVATLCGEETSAVFAWGSSGRMLWRQAVSSTLAWTAPIAGDIDGDLRREILVATSDGVLHEFDQSGLVNRTVDLGSTWPRISFIDATGDGVAEVVSAGLDRLTVLDGVTFEELMSYSAPAPHMLYPSAAVADVDSDGAVDFFTGNYRAKTLLGFELDVESRFRWTALGGASTHHGELELGGTAGSQSGRITTVQAALNNLLLDPSVTFQQANKIEKAISRLDEALESVENASSAQLLRALRHAITELQKHQELESLAPYVDELFAIAYDFTSDVVSWGDENGKLNQRDSTLAPGVLDLSLETSATNLRAAMLSLEMLMRSMGDLADDFLEEVANR